MGLLKYSRHISQFSYMTLKGSMHADAYQAVTSYLNKFLLNTDRLKDGPSCFYAYTEADGFDTRTDLLAMYRLQQVIIENILPMLTSSRIVFMQFPINLRYIHPESRFGVDAGNSYCPFIPHMDIWSGSPFGSKNFFAHILCDSASTRFFVGPKPVTDELRCGYRGPYCEAPKVKCADMDELAQLPGSFACWPANTVHHLSMGKSPSLSIDFRFVDSDIGKFMAELPSGLDETLSPTLSSFCYLPTSWFTGDMLNPLYSLYEEESRDLAGLVRRFVEDHYGAILSC